jgi:hypothetical protein
VFERFDTEERMSVMSATAAINRRDLVGATIATPSFMLLTLGNARLIATFGNAAPVAAFAEPQIAEMFQMVNRRASLSAWEPRC